jgi:hypothetical protein
MTRSAFQRPQVTVEAIMWPVRERGVAALEEAANQERLKKCDAAAMAQIDLRIKKLGLGNDEFSPSSTESPADGRAAAAAGH